MLSTTAEIVLSQSPDRLIMKIKGLEMSKAYEMAFQATSEARRQMPKVTGAAADRIEPVYGPGFFGVMWQDKYVWYQDRGIRAFTMNSLAGKTIPMWVNDPGGAIKAKNPKAKTRTTVDGRQQTLIFRKAAKKGTRIQKFHKDPNTGAKYLVSDKPASYPGAPGRIGSRNAAGTKDENGNSIGGQISKGNTGVRWRHPGLEPRLFLNNSLTTVSQRYGFLPTIIYVTDGTWAGRMDK